MKKNKIKTNKQTKLQLIYELVNVAHITIYLVYLNKDSTHVVDAFGSCNKRIGWNVFFICLFKQLPVIILRFLGIMIAYAAKSL